MAAKDAGLRTRVERTLRDDFLKAYRAKDKPAAQVMRTYVVGHAETDREASAGRQSRKITRVSKGG